MGGFYFSLPRLLAHCCRGNAQRSENNFWETNLVGILIHLVTLAFAFRLVLGNRALWQQLFFFLPLVVGVWFFWLLLFYVDALLIKMLRSFGLMRTWADDRGQTVLIAIMTTVFALALIDAPRAFQLIGMTWIGAVALNFFAAIALAFVVTDVSAPE